MLYFKFVKYLELNFRNVQLPFNLTVKNTLIFTKLNDPLCKVFFFINIKIIRQLKNTEREHNVLIQSHPSPS